jgi:hypothetical protein
MFQGRREHGCDAPANPLPPGEGRVRVFAATPTAPAESHRGALTPTLSRREREKKGARERHRLNAIA